MVKTVYNMVCTPLPSLPFSSLELITSLLKDIKVMVNVDSPLPTNIVVDKGGEIVLVRG